MTDEQFNLMIITDTTLPAEPVVHEGVWKDNQGITHIVVSDLNLEYALCDDGKFREVAPF